MDSWLIPAASVTVVEEIKKSRFITLLAHTDGVDAAKRLLSQSELSILMRVTIAWRGWRGRRTTHSNWAFQTTVNRRERQASRCLRN
ncbi:protein co-occurring with transport systems [Salmonella enterica subsp. diarizonae]|uniref:Protein co-occurring with transport systems n=1 Tax=Salmonella diarizonae TaxID=59204 RepID=A0A379U758_SALDZ|nr:protein co-occurring with transport systems [Salmonella enterica subsp. diarizonae]